MRMCQFMCARQSFAARCASWKSPNENAMNSSADERMPSAFQLISAQRYARCFLANKGSRFPGNRLAASKLVPVRVQDGRPGCINVGHQLRPARVTIGVIPLGEFKVADAEVTPGHRLDMDAQTAEQGESVG
jgi:hypothetical protein